MNHENMPIKGYIKPTKLDRIFLAGIICLFVAMIVLVLWMEGVI